MRRLGTLFVQRYDTLASLADTDNAITVARQERNIVFFPEGSFTRRAGLFRILSWRLQGGLLKPECPLCPAFSMGRTRSMLRGDQWFPLWSPLGATIEKPIIPSGTDFASLLQLRDATRKVVLAGCGEPDLGSW